MCESCDQPTGRDSCLTRIYHVELIYLALECPPLLCFFPTFKLCDFCVEKMTIPSLTQIGYRRRQKQLCKSSRFPVTQILMRSWCHAATEDTLASVALQITLKLLDQFHQLPQLRREPMCLLPHWRRICLNVLMLDREELDTVFVLFSATLVPASHLLFRPMPCLHFHPLKCNGMSPRPTLLSIYTGDTERSLFSGIGRRIFRPTEHHGCESSQSSRRLEDRSQRNHQLDGRMARREAT